MINLSYNTMMLVMLSPRPKFLLSVITIAAAGNSSCTFESTTPGINANAAVSGSAYSPPPSCLTFRTYTGAIFTVPKTSKFFVIKSYNILDVNASFIHNIWTSTELGNRRLDKAYTELSKTNNPDVDGKIFLFFWSIPWVNSVELLR